MLRDRKSVLRLLVRSCRLAGLLAGAMRLYLRNRFSRATETDFRSFAERYVRVASLEKGALIKLGQLASLRVDVFPEAVSETLSQLQDRVEPREFSAIRLRLVEELGEKWSDAFPHFETEPIAAASLGQVHRAQRTDGRSVAVKVLYPGIEETVRLDLLGARIGLWLFNFVTISDLRLVFREVRDSLHREMDYELEARASETIAANLALDAQLKERIRIPKIHWDLTRRRVLTMEFVEGETLRAFVGRQEGAAAGVPYVFWVVRAFLHQMFVDGFFHCDPHPGNLLIDSEQRIVLIDFGMNKGMSDRLRKGLRRNVWATMRRDPVGYADSLREAGMIDTEDLAAVERVAEVMFDPEYFNLTPREFADLDFSRYMRRMRGELKEVKSFSLPDGVVMWFRSFSLLLTLGAELAPGMRPVDILGPHMAHYLAEEARAS